MAPVFSEFVGKFNEANGDFLAGIVEKTQNVVKGQIIVFELLHH
jgi:hypothetical protein